MKYQYEKYYRQFYLIPMFSFLFFLFIGIMTIVAVIQNGVPKNDDKISLFILKHGSIIVASFFGIAMNLYIFFKRGICLKSENPKQVLSLSGVVNEIKYLKGIFSGQTLSVIEIREKTYFVFQCDSINIGDTVKILYLPKSRFILEMYWIES